MTYAERGSIRAAVDGFFATGLVDEVVVNNNAEAGTSEAVAGRRGARGLRAAPGVWLDLAAAAGRGDRGSSGPGRTGRHLLAARHRKLLASSGDCDAVFGTRTTREFVWGEANMGAFFKWGNWAVAKQVEVLFNTGHLSDVGCTSKLLSQPLAARLLPTSRWATPTSGRS